MSYIGNQPTSVAFLTDSFSGNGSTTVFTMSVAPATTSSILVAITGVVQDPSTYSVSGTTLTFSAAPPSGTGNISVRYLGIPASGVTTTAYRTVTEFTATAGQTTFTPPSYTVGYLNVYMNGVLLGSADYTATNGTTVVLASGAVAGALITTESFYVSSVLNAIPATAGSVGTSYLVDDSVTSDKLASGLTLAGTTTFGGLIDTGSTGQIKFPATQNPSNDANTLDDYEEGAWTPSVGGTATYTARAGQYIKIGSQVTIWFDITINIIGTGSGSQISGIPFIPVASSNGQGGCPTYWSNLSVSPVYLSLRVDNGGAVIYIGGSTSGTATLNAGFACLQNSSRIIGTLTYTA